MRAHLVRTALLFALLLPGLGESQQSTVGPEVLPPVATKTLAASLAAARQHASHIWRDTAPVNRDGTINAYIEIPRGDRGKWEFDMGANRRTIDRMIPVETGGYPVNYGFVPQTVSYDGDPFDALVLGPPLPGGHFVRGLPVGLMLMEDEKGLDSKVVLSPVSDDGRPLYPLTASIRTEIGNYFRRYKRHEPGRFSNVPGWGSAAQGVALVGTTYRFFRTCADRAGRSCSIGGKLDESQ